MIISNLDAELYDAIKRSKNKREGLVLIVAYKKRIMEITERFFTQGMVRVQNVDAFLKDCAVNNQSDEVKAFLKNFKGKKLS